MAPNVRALDLGRAHFCDFCDEECVVKNIFSSSTHEVETSGSL